MGPGGGRRVLCHHGQLIATLTRRQRTGYEPDTLQIETGHGVETAALQNTLRVAGYGTLDFRADWHVAREWTLGLRLNNVGDKAYETVYGYNQPGREAYVTLRYSGL